jgi:ADP-L-glycero-D-manno-heptose 6-epimerase
MLSVVDKADIWRKSRILVTGGAGFIGSALVWGLNRQDCTNIVIADPAPRSERWQNLDSLHFADYLKPGDVLATYASGSLGKFDFIFHIGACSSTTETDEDYLRRNNYEFSRDLAGLALSAGARFVYASSAATYGAATTMDDTDPRNLESLLPLNPYGQSKQMMDLHAWREGWLDRIVGLKYFNVFGPNESHKGDMRSMVHKSFEQVKESGAIRLFKSYRSDYRDGEQRRDFLYVKDAVAMTLYLAANPNANGIFNLGSGQARTWNELARAVFAALGQAPHIEYVEMPANIRNQYQYFTQANIGKLCAAGYSEPITLLEDAVRDYVVNYLLPGKSLASETEASAR